MGHDDADSCCCQRRLSLGTHSRIARAQRKLPPAGVCHACNGFSDACGHRYHVQLNRAVTPRGEGKLAGPGSQGRVLVMWCVCVCMCVCVCVCARARARADAICQHASAPLKPRYSQGPLQVEARRHPGRLASRNCRRLSPTKRAHPFIARLPSRSRSVTSCMSVSSAPRASLGLVRPTIMFTQCLKVYSSPDTSPLSALMCKGVRQPVPSTCPCFQWS